MKKGNKTKRIMRESAKGLKEIMQTHLAVIADSFIKQVDSASRRLIPSRRLDALHDLHPTGIAEYKAVMLDAMALIAEDGLAAVRKEVPKAKRVELAAIDNLPRKFRDKLKTRNDLLIGKQIGDLQKVIEFAYATSEDSTDSDDTILEDMRDSALGWLDGTALTAGADLTASTIINEIRDEFFSDPDVLEQLDAFEFVNGDPVTEICQDLAGTVFSKDDPDRFRYTPPLHWNCKSYILPILAGDLGNREVQKLKPSTAKLEKQIQFSDIFSIVKDCKEVQDDHVCH